MAAYKHHTVEEIIQMLKDGKLPNKEDLPQLIKYLQKFVNLIKYANAVQEANHYLD